MSMIKTYKILSLLLDYPSQETIGLLSSAQRIMEQEGLLDRTSLKHVDSFVREVRHYKLLNWKERYTAQFDYAAPTSLYLFDHVYGDSRKRGMAMVDLKQLYASEGMEIFSGELPDFLPVMLEFIANCQTQQEGADLLAETAHVLTKIESALYEGNSPYGHLLSVLAYLASKGEARPLTSEEKAELEQLHACETCFFNGSAGE